MSERNGKSNYKPLKALPNYLDQNLIHLYFLIKYQSFSDLFVIFKPFLKEVLT